MCMQAHESYTVRARSLLKPIIHTRDLTRQISNKFHIVRTNSCCRRDDEPALAGMTVLGLLNLHMTLVRLPLECNPAIQGGV
jgi:hypothetical protein